MAKESCFQLTIEDDDIVEDTELFSLKLETNDSRVVAKRDELELRVLDNDRK